MNVQGYYCPRCEKRVYFAEEVIAMGRHWHKSCFLCANPTCKKRLDSRTCTDHEGEAYCNICYKRQFGPKGYGFGGGSGALSMDNGTAGTISTSNRSSYSEAQVAPLMDVNGQLPRYRMNTGAAPSRFGGAGSDVCPRCKKAVYFAEKVIGGGSAWHKMTCFTCYQCNKKLQSTSLCEREAEIYCKTCYGRSFGPKGYGFGVGAGILNSEA